MLDRALERLRDRGPDLRNGNTSHAPMVVEALCALGRPEEVAPFLDRHLAEILPRPPERERIEEGCWREALAKQDRFSDWSAFFANELAGEPWRDLLDRWVARLAPGICAAAMHGVIRASHATRALGASESKPRVAELADALASWASTYQELPTSRVVEMSPLAPREAIARVRPVPPERRRFTGTIASSLEALDEFPEFAGVIGLLDTRADPADLVAEMAEVFARVLLANAHDVLSAIVFTHGVTSVAALANLLPHIRHETARVAVPYSWQAAAGLYASFGSRPAAFGPIDFEGEDAESLADRAIAHGDEHAIKLTEACLSQDARRPSPVFEAAARRVLDLLPAAR